MRAVLIATGFNEETAALREHYPSPMLPLVDRPFVQHVVEALVERGVTEFDFVLSHLPERIERHFGDGTRWGSVFRYHLAREPQRPYKLLRALDWSAANGPVLLGHADRLPALPRDGEWPAADGPVLVGATDVDAAGAPWRWSGWALVPATLLANLEGDPDEAAFAAMLEARAAERLTAPPPLSVCSWPELLASHRRVLAGEITGLMLSGNEVQPGVWIGRNVVLHPTAQVRPPVYLGENSRVGRGAVLGPNAVIGPNCLLDNGCSVAETVVLPGSYVGETLEVSDAVIDRNCIVNVRIDAATTVADNFILGGIAQSYLHARLVGLLSRLAALALLMVTLPLLLATALAVKATRRGPLRSSRRVLRLPTSMLESDWRTFRPWSFEGDGARDGRRHGPRDLLLRAVPGLINVLRGEMRFIGVPPRTPDEARRLPHDWRALYLASKPGLITEADIYYGDSPNDDELYSAEARYSVAGGFRHDLGLLARYLVRILAG